jgi:hypothetical protein
MWGVFVFLQAIKGKVSRGFFVKSIIVGSLTLLGLSAVSFAETPRLGAAAQGVTPYGMTFQVEKKCNPLSVEQFIEEMKLLANFCEFISADQAKKGFPRCPTYMCPNTVTSPATSPGPTIKVVIGTRDPQQSRYYGPGSSIYSSSIGMSGPGMGGPGMGGNSDSVLDRISISIELVLPLSKNPNLMSCFFPMTPDILKESLGKINEVATTKGGLKCD